MVVELGRTVVARTVSVMEVEVAAIAPEVDSNLLKASSVVPSAIASANVVDLVAVEEVGLAFPEADVLDFNSVVDEPDEARYVVESFVDVPVSVVPIDDWKTLSVPLAVIAATVVFSEEVKLVFPRAVAFLAVGKADVSDVAGR